MPSPRRGGSRLRATVVVFACLSVGLVTAAALAPAAGAAGLPAAAFGGKAGSGAIGSPAAAGGRAAVVQEGAVTGAVATGGPGAEVGAVLELTPPSGSDQAVARLAATRSVLSRAQRVAALTALAPPASAEAGAVAWAAARGLTVNRRDRWVVSVSGPAAAMGAAFAAVLVPAPSGFAPAGPAAYLRPITAPKVPAALAGIVHSVTGLDTRPAFAPRVASPQALGDFGYTGDRLRDAYGVPRDPAAGTGITVATIQFSGFNAVDFSHYAGQAGIPLFAGQLTSVSVDGYNPAAIIGTGDVEVDLDTQAILSVAPLARQRAYFAPNSLSGEIDALNKIADDAVAGLVQVVSSSWGHCEVIPDTVASGEAAAVRAAIQRMVAAGATMSASSGDSGSHDCGASPTPNAVDFPTSVPEVVSVGGTTLTTGYQSGWSGSGGGESAIFARPAYQNGLGGTGKRMVPDVALLADPNTGFAVVRGNSIATVGGTSLASPLFAGLLAGALSEADRSTGVGDIHAAMYGAPADAFQDVATGSNGAFTAGAGYDQVTGLGAPRFGALAEALGIAPVGRTTYHPIDPNRIADTRTGHGVALARLGAGASLTITVPGSAPGVPLTGVTAAVVNVTAINPTASTYLSVFPTGAAGATSTSSVNAVPGTPTPNLVTVKTDPSGRISIYNRAGTVDVAVDLAGYYARDSADLYTPVNPARILDTRSGTGVAVGKVGPGGTVTLHVAGAGGLPPGGVDAVTLNVTAVNASAPTHVSAYPTGFTGGAQSSNLNVPPAKAVANMVITKVSAGGDVTFLNSSGSVDLIADVQGYYTSGSGLSLAPVSPVRILDTRPGVLGSNITGTFLVASTGSRARAVVANLTGVQPTSGTYLSLFPSNVSVPVGRSSSSLNIDAGAVRANLTTTAIAAADPLTEVVYNHSGNIAVLADVAGYFCGQPIRLPQTSVGASGPASVAPGVPATFTVTATAPGGQSVLSLAPGATVELVDAGAKEFGPAPIDASGVAHFTLSWASPGTHTLYAVVAAHDGIAGSTSALLTVTVT